MGQTTQSVAVWTTDWVDLGAGLMVLQVSSWLHAASHIASGGINRPGRRASPGAVAPGVELLECRDEVSAEGELLALGAGPETGEAPAARDVHAIERRYVIQGCVVANLRPEGDRLE